MKSLASLLGLTLAAALLLPACAPAPVAPAPIKEVRQSVALMRAPVAPRAGSVSVSFPGLAPRPRTYRTLATQADIETVGTYLIDARTGHSQHLDRQALERPRVDASFKSVATWPSCGSPPLLARFFPTPALPVAEASPSAPRARPFKPGLGAVGTRGSRGQQPLRPGRLVDLTGPTLLP
ncbi:MAG: hypothetical protein VKS61_01840 [Candidatus Sericytochromatia bacterium]|nr:hypothetical protein [Candidatus Sericytochromatia bacterium]